MSTRLPLALATLATLALSTTLGACRAHATEAPRYDGNGKACPAQAEPVQGLSPLTFCSPALPASTYMHPAYPEARPLAAPSLGGSTTHGTIHTSHGTVHFNTTTK